MSVIESYGSIVKEISGRRSKNRYKYEVYWGISRILELHESPENYAIIFDNACDIDEIIDESIKFYQLKTRTNERGFSVKNLLSKKKNEFSILANLYKLNDEKLDIKMYIVSNKKLIDAKNEVHLFSFSDLDDKNKELVKQTLIEELEVEPDLSRIFFLKSDISLIGGAENDQILGRCSRFLDNIFPGESMRPNAFFSSLYKLAIEKATCEEFISDLGESIAKLGITRNDIDELLKRYQVANDYSIEKMKSNVDSLELGLKRSMEIKSLINKICLDSIKSLSLSRKIDKKIMKVKELKIDYKCLSELIIAISDSSKALVKELEDEEIALAIIGVYKYERCLV